MGSRAAVVPGSETAPPKRKLSPELLELSQSARFDHGPVVQRLVPAMLSQGDIDRKRRRLSNVTPDILRSARSEEMILSNPLRLGDLPHEILQHIFTFIDPISLGRLICVNRCFRSLLDPALSLPEASASDKVTHLTTRSQDLIWATSRRRYLQGFPKPMDQMTELEMWRLVLGRSCQFCGKHLKSPPALASDPWNAGPGLETVRTVWPFRVRSCGSCLRPRLVKESELLVSSSSGLRPGLPFAIFTQSLNYVPSVVIQQTETPPLQDLCKYYFRSQLEDLQSEFNDAQILGPPATAEWYKGLETSGQERNADAARFDQWELQGGLSRISATRLHHIVNFDRSPGTDPRQEHEVQSFRRVLQNWQPSPGGSKLNVSSHAVPSPQTPPPARPASLAYPLPVLHQSFVATEAALQPDRQDPSTPISWPSQPRQRTERTLKEVEQSKAERRREIEKRCLQLKPPIKPLTLTYMDAFEAATQIARPMTDEDWNFLMPRLLGQRAEAERKEQAFNATLGNPAMQLEHRRRLDEEQRVAQENLSHMLHKLKIPSRDKIQKYAREFIQQAWSDGRAVTTKSTACTFAAEVICQVRYHFYAVIAHEDAMLEMKGIAFPSDPDSMACRRLRLDDMKWTFEEFIKPHTERFGKELFLCSMCEANPKLFSFEAVIQHYAAKHTSSLSRGNATVYWKAEWPAEPPFDRNPNIPWALGGGHHDVPQLHARPQNSLQNWSSQMGVPSMPGHDSQSRANEVSASAHELWERTAGIWDLPKSVRLYIVIQHVDMRFRKRFESQLDLPLFSEVISLRPELHGLRALADLRCRACSGLDRVAGLPHNAREESCYSLSELLHHFRQAHVESDASSFNERGRAFSLQPAPDTTGFDWKQDMIWLPSDAAIRALIDSKGMDQDKLEIIAEALPKHFPHPIPQLESVVQRPIASMQQLTDHRNQSFPERDHFRTGSVHGSAPGDAVVVKSEGSGHLLEDEYDPRHPAPPLPLTSQRRGQHLPFSPARDEAGFRNAAHPYAHPIAQGQAYYREVEHRLAKQAHHQDRPYSRDSMVYSYEAGSSRWSYRDPLPRDSETTVGGVSEVQLGSKAQSQRSLPLGADSDSRVSTIETDGQRLAGNETESNAAVDFLNNFNPMEELGVGRAAEASRNVRATVPQAPNALRPQAMIGRHQQVHTDDPTGHLFLDNGPMSWYRETPALPIQQSARPSLARGEYEIRREYVPWRPHEAELGSSRGMPSGHGYAEELPERRHRVLYDVDDERLVDGAYAAYGKEYYSEEPFTRRGARYETARPVVVESNPRLVEDMPVRYVEFPRPGNSRFVDDRLYRLDHDGRKEQVQRERRDPRPDGDDFSFGYDPGPHYGYSDYDDRRNVRGFPLLSGQQAPRIPMDGREVIDEDGDQPRRHTPRSMHMGTEEEEKCFGLEPHRGR